MEMIFFVGFILLLFGVGELLLVLVVAILAAPFILLEFLGQLLKGEVCWHQWDTWSTPKDGVQTRQCLKCRKIRKSQT